MLADEHVVLVDEHGRPTGTMPKRDVHTADTPLHLAFSCYLFDDAGRLLLTRRAWTKATWPGFWTNTCCGHPLPDEPMLDAVARRLRWELSTSATDLRLTLPDFRYRAEHDGVVENEICPVFTGRIAGPVEPHPDEVAETRWVGLDDLRAELASGVLRLSPWATEQLALLQDGGGSYAPAK